MDFLKEGNKVKFNTIIKNLQKRNMEGFYCETKEEALEKALSLINQDETVGWGGSVTLDQLGIKSKLEEKGNAVYDRDKAKSPAERMQIMRSALTSDVFITSTNAITLDGELFNIDGNANRIAAIAFGPNKVIIIAGYNKIVTNLDACLNKVRTDVTVPNAMRIGVKTPCTITGKCSECTTPETACGQFLTTRYSRIPNRIKVILVNEILGF